jgi:hypothetical protein
VLDAVAPPEFFLFSNDAALNAELEDLQRDERVDDLWTDIFVKGEEWIVPTPPESSQKTIYRIESENEEPHNSGGDGEPGQPRDDQGGPDASLLESLGAALPRADFYDVVTLARPSVAATVVRPIWDSHEVVQQPAPVHFLKVDEQPWRQVILPIASTRIEIVDVVRSEELPSLLFCITDRAGVFRSRDFGASWEDANFAEASLRQASSVRVLLAPGPTIYALALLHDRPGDDLNPLFRLEHRDWVTRWQIGLGGFLSDVSWLHHGDTGTAEAIAK